MNSNQYLERGWTKVQSRREKRNMQVKPRPVKHYWIGFDNDGNERWYLELSDGKVLTPRDVNYNFWMKRFFPNRKY